MGTALARPRYRPYPGEVVATARHSGEHVFIRDGKRLGVTLVAYRPTILPTSVALALAPDGVQISDKNTGEMWRRMRLVTEDDQTERSS